MKITKKIIQTSLYELPQYHIENILKNNTDWDYEYFDDEKIIEFIKNNPIDELINSLHIFENIKKGQHKADFFRYYYLYLKGGVFLDYDISLKSSLTPLLKNLSFFTCKSFMNNNSMFNGFIGAEPKNFIIYEALKKIYFTNYEILEKDYFFNCRELNSIIDTYKNVMNSLFVNSTELLDLKCKIFNERAVIITDKNEKLISYDFETLGISYKNKEFEEKYSYTEVYDDDKNAILEHHFKDKYYFFEKLFNEMIQDKKIISYETTKIGITLDLPTSLSHIYSNGIKQNVFYLAELLLNIGYDTYFIVNDSYNIDVIKQISYDKRFQFIKHKKILSSNFHIVISMGYEIERDLLKMLKFMKTKIISYNCGNSYIIDSETILYNQHKNRKNVIHYVNINENIPYDIIWSIPQMTNTNQYYWQTLLRTKCIEVPFIWSYNSIELTKIISNKTEKELSYVNRGKEKKLVIFEPNISIMKWCGPSVLICENAYRIDPDTIKQVYINNINDKKADNTLNDFNLDAFTVLVNNLNICKHNKLSIEGRFNTLEFMNHFADIAVSHQWENNLNYLYFDLAWMGWPIIHNAKFCSEIGYFYNEFNYEEGGKKLLEVIYNHDNNIEEYTIKNRLYIDKYLPTNKELQQKYIDLINQLFENE